MTIRSKVALNYIMLCVSLSMIPGIWAAEMIYKAVMLS